MNFQAQPEKNMYLLKRQEASRTATCTNVIIGAVKDCIAIFLRGKRHLFRAAKRHGCTIVMLRKNALAGQAFLLAL